MACDGSQFDILLKDGQSFKVGELEFRVMSTPGHTPACVSYYVADQCIFVGDTLFMPDSGTARCDFPGGSSQQMWDSLQKILSLPDETTVYVCHDYKAGGKRDEFEWTTTIAEERKNVQLHEKSADEYMEFRSTRDSGLSAPRLIHPSLQYNLRAGRSPHPAFVKIPVTNSWEQKQ